tara:strand:+ start:910 stop:1680 length:771 start_codon:yes stop_codon:yes gene_type:complete
MSRFDRRLKPQEFNNRQTYRRSSSPRPGEATCKLRPRNKNNGMLGSTLFMGDTTNPNRPSIEVIENAIASPSQNSEPVSSNTQTITMDNVSVKNGMLVEKLKTIRDPNVRIIYNHEIRLNTIEATVDCLNDIKCGEVLNEQKKNEEIYVMKDLELRIKNDEKLISQNKIDLNLIKENITDINNNNDEIKKKIRENLEYLEGKIELRIDEKINGIESIKNENIELKEKIQNLKEILKNVLLSNDENKEDILVEIENL